MSLEPSDGAPRMVALADLHESSVNPRRISEERFADLQHALQADPDMLWARPVMATTDGEVLGGNMRLRAAEALSWTEIPTFVLPGDPATNRERMLRDNAPYGEWVPEELAALIRAHEQDGADMALLGFSEGELSGLLALTAEAPAGGGLEGADPDEVPEPPEQPVTAPGDRWVLGEHRLVCASADHAESYGHLLRTAALDAVWDGSYEPVDCLWTDPPYGVAYDPEARASYFSPERLANPLGEIQGDAKQEGEPYAAWLALVFGHCCETMRPGSAAYVCHAATMMEWAARGFREAGFYLSSQLLWFKTMLVFGRSDYHWKHEPILYGWKPGEAHRWYGDRKQTTIFEVESDHYSAEGRKEGYVPPTQKPYDLIRPHLENSTQPGDVVLDPFGGSGSTLIVCELLARKARLLELDPRYCDVIVKRWERFTGREAELHRLVAT